MSQSAPYTVEMPYELNDALDMSDAREAARVIARKRKAAKDKLADAIDDYESALAEEADKERTYRKHKAHLWLKAEGDTAKAKEAWVDAESATARYERDIATGLAKGALQRIKLAEEELQEVDGERASFHRLVEWSARTDPFAQESRTVPA